MIMPRITSMDSILPGFWEITGSIQENRIYVRLTQIKLMLYSELLSNPTQTRRCQKNQVDENPASGLQYFARPGNAAG